jgi:hypothetical protein
VGRVLIVGNSGDDQYLLPKETYLPELIEHLIRCWDAERENADRLPKKGRVPRVNSVLMTSPWICQEYGVDPALSVNSYLPPSRNAPRAPVTSAANQKIKYRLRNCLPVGVRSLAVQNIAALGPR